MDNDESKLKVTLEERIKSAMDRYYKSQAAGSGRKLLRRKNNKGVPSRAGTRGFL